MHEGEKEQTNSSSGVVGKGERERERDGLQDGQFYIGTGLQGGHGALEALKAHLARQRISSMSL